MVVGWLVGWLAARVELVTGVVRIFKSTKSTENNNNNQQWDRISNALPKFLSMNEAMENDFTFVCFSVVGTAKCGAICWQPNKFSN